MHKPIARKQILLLALPLLVVVAVTVWLKWPKTLEWHAHRLFDCIEANDAQCVAGYVREGDLKPIGMGRAEFARFFSNEVYPSFSKFDSAKRARSTEVNKASMGFEEPGTMSNGSEGGIGFTMADTDEGIKAPNLPMSFLAVLVSYRSYRTLTTNNLTNFSAAYVDFSRKHGPELEKNYGLKGFLFDRREGLVTWQEKAHYSAAKLPPEVLETLDKL